MPNHVKTCFRVEHESDYDIEDKIAAAVRSEESGEEKAREFDFNKIIPMPADVFRGNLGAAEEAKYPGEKNWYGWCPKYWGTKWNAYEFSRHYERFSFQTAWSHPFPILKKLSEMFPDATFEVMYADEDIGNNCGAYKMLNGEIIEECKLDNPTIFAEALWA